VSCRWYYIHFRKQHNMHLKDKGYYLECACGKEFHNASCDAKHTQKNGIFLICSCGYEKHILTYDPKHSEKICDGRKFSLLNLDEEK
ncbi:hypothetical protein PENTCL1PPCAC_30489, partial [Pristionchus entomophagus]